MYFPIPSFNIINLLTKGNTVSGSYSFIHQEWGQVKRGWKRQNTPVRTNQIYPQIILKKYLEVKVKTNSFVFNKMFSSNKMFNVSEFGHSGNQIGLQWILQASQKDYDQGPQCQWIMVVWIVRWLGKNALEENSLKLKSWLQFEDLCECYKASPVDSRCPRVLQH